MGLTASRVSHGEELPDVPARYNLLIEEPIAVAYLHVPAGT